jgi:hypothetical protein
VVLGNPNSGELLALKRLGIPVGRTARTTLRFAATHAGDGDDASAQPALRVYLLSDSYIGLDQCVDVAAGGARDAEEGSVEEPRGAYIRDAWPALDFADNA